MLLLSFSNVKEKEKKKRKGEQVAARKCTRGVVFLFFELDAHVFLAWGLSGQGALICCVMVTSALRSLPGSLQMEVITTTS